MSEDKFDWVDKREEEIDEARSKGYFKIEEGDNRFILLSHFAPLAQVFDPATKKYRIAQEGEKGASIKGVCWVAQQDPVKDVEGQTEWNVKEAKMPYTVVKQVRDLSKNDDWDFQLPFPHMLNLKATNAGEKSVQYSLQPSPKEIEIPIEVIRAFEEKDSPEEVVNKIKTSKSEGKVDYPDEDINPYDIPF